MVNRNVKNAACLAGIALAAVLAIHHAADYVHFHQHMAGLGIDEETICDSACADKAMGGHYDRYELGYACVELSVRTVTSAGRRAGPTIFSKTATRPSR